MKLDKFAVTPPIIAISAMLLSFTGAAAPKIVYVAPDGTGDGSSWDAPTANVANAYAAAAAFADAGCDSGEVWVKTGRYIFTAAIELKPKVSVYGGFAEFTAATTKADATPDVTPTVFTGDKNADDVWQPNGLAPETPLPIWSGDDMMTFNPPNPSEDEDFWVPYRGAYANTSYAFKISKDVTDVFEDCTFCGLVFTCFGDAPFYSNNATFFGTISKCRFLANDTEKDTYGYGDGIRMCNAQMTIEDCEFDGNCNALYLDAGAAFVDRRGDGRVSTIRRCRFAHCGYSCITLIDRTTAVANMNWLVEDCVFERNATGTGTTTTGIFHQDSAGVTSRLDVNRCIFRNNRVRTANAGMLQDQTGYGKHYFKFQVTDCVFSNNICSTAEAGKGVSAGLILTGSGDSWGELLNCAFIGNKAISGADGAIATAAGLTIGSHRYMTCANCTFLKNELQTTCDGALASTVGIAAKDTRLHVVNSVFRENDFSAVAGGSCGDFRSINNTFNTSLTAFNSIFYSTNSEYVAFSSRATATGNVDMPYTFSHVFVSNFDKDKIGDAYFSKNVEVTSDKDPQLDDLKIGSGKLPAQGVGPYSPYKRAGIPVWHTGTGEFYLFDPACFGANTPWFSLFNQSYKTTAEVEALGVTLETPLLPDAFDAARVMGEVAYGPLNAPVPGLMLLLR